MLKISSDSAVPVYEQLKRQIRMGIVSGRYSEDFRMPSIRDLAAELTINPNTIAKVYRQLEAEGFLKSKAGSGFFVHHSHEKIKETRLLLFRELADEFIAESVALGVKPQLIKETIESKLQERSSDDQS